MAARKAYARQRVAAVRQGCVRMPSWAASVPGPESTRPSVSATHLLRMRTAIGPRAKAEYIWVMRWLRRIMKSSVGRAADHSTAVTPDEDAFVRVEPARPVALEARPGAPVGYVSPYLDSARWDELLVADDQGNPPLRLEGFRGSLWLRESTTGQFVNAGNRKLPALGIWTVKVRGSKHYASSIRASLLSPGASADLRREPGNEYDRNAIAIVGSGGTLGYFNTAMAARLAKLLDAGDPFEAIVTEVIDSDDGSNMKVLVAAPELLQFLLH
jgi:hypothetical protein